MNDNRTENQERENERRARYDAERLQHEGQEEFPNPRCREWAREFAAGMHAATQTRVQSMLDQHKKEMDAWRDEFRQSIRVIDSRIQAMQLQLQENSSLLNSSTAQLMSFSSRLSAVDGDVNDPEKGLKSRVRDIEKTKGMIVIAMGLAWTALLGIFGALWNWGFKIYDHIHDMLLHGVSKIGGQ